MDKRRPPRVLEHTRVGLKLCGHEGNGVKKNGEKADFIVLFLEILEIKKGHLKHFSCTRVYSHCVCSMCGARAKTAFHSFSWPRTTSPPVERRPCWRCWRRSSRPSGL